MNYVTIYKNINDILKIVEQPAILPIDGCSDHAQQIDHLFQEYLDRFILAFPKWTKYKDKPEMINDIGMQYLVRVREK